jgi:hypothetical protein
VLPAFWRKWCRRAAAVPSVPLDYVALSLLTAAAGLIGAARCVRPVPAWIEPCVLWTALVSGAASDPAVGMEPVMRLLRTLDRELADAANLYRHGGSPRRPRRAGRSRLVTGNTDASLVAAADPAAPRVVRPIVHRQLIADQPTIEAVAETLIVNARGILLACESLEAWLYNMGGRDCRSADRSLWRKAWSAEPWPVALGERRGFRLASAAVSILGSVESATSAQTLTADEDVGSCLLFAWPHSALRQRLSKAPAMGGLKALRALRRLRDLPRATRVLPLSPEALAAFEDFRRAHASSGPLLDDVEAAWWGRGPNNVLRLAGVLTFLEWATRANGAEEPAVVPLTAVQAATVLWHGYLCRHAEAVRGMAGGSIGHESCAEDVGNIAKTNFWYFW